MSVGYISVIIPVYNGVPYIEDALSSVFSQTRPPEEVLVVDDGSTDDLLTALEPYMDRIVLAHQENRGCSAARNTGLRLAKNSIVAFLDADDRWYPEKLKAQTDLLAKAPECGVVFTNWLVRDTQGVGLHEGFSNSREKLSPRQIDARYVGPGMAVTLRPPFTELLETYFLHTSTALINREVAGDVTFDERFGWGEDWLFFLELGRRAPFGYVDRVLAEYRMNTSGICMTANLDTVADKFVCSLEPLRRYANLTTRQMELLTPRISSAALNYGYRLMDEAGDAAAARAVWHQAACACRLWASWRLAAYWAMPPQLFGAIRRLKKLFF